VTLRRLALLAFAIVPALAGCGTLETYRFQYGAANPPSRRPAVYFEGNAPNVATMHEIALVEAVGTGTKADMQDVVNALIDEAYRFGANAIVRVRVDCGFSQCHGVGVAVHLAAK